MASEFVDTSNQTSEGGVIGGPVTVDASKLPIKEVLKKAFKDILTQKVDEFAEGIGDELSAEDMSKSEDDSATATFVEEMEKAEMASKSKTWDAGAARKALKAWATGADGKVNVAKYAQGFLYQGCKTTGNLGDCKFPIKTVVDGKLVTVPAAVKAAKGRLASEGKTKAKIPGSARTKMKGQLNAASSKIGWKPNTMAKADYPEAEHEFSLFTSNEPDRKNVVYGVVYSPNEIDTQGNWASPEAIEDAAHWYMEHAQLHDAEHRKLLAKHDARPIESYIAKSDITIEGRNVPQGSWVQAARVSDDIKQDVDDGVYAGFSMFGKQLSLYGSTPPGYEVQDEDERMSIAELVRIRPLSVGLVAKNATREPFIIARCDGSDCPLKSGKPEESNMEKSEQGVEGTVPKVPETIDAPVTTTEPMAKGQLTEIPEEYRSYVEDLLKKSNEENEKRVEEAMAKAAKLEDEQRTREFMAKASELDQLPTEGLGELLKEISTKAPEAYDKLEEVLRAANAGLAKSALFDEVGSPRITADSAEGRVNARAEELMAKSDGKLSKASAIATAWSEDPKAYEEYVRELKRRVA